MQLTKSFVKRSSVLWYLLHRSAQMSAYPGLCLAQRQHSTHSPVLIKAILRSLLGYWAKSVTVRQVYPVDKRKVLTSMSCACCKIWVSSVYANMRLAKSSCFPSMGSIEGKFFAAGPITRYQSSFRPAGSADASELSVSPLNMRPGPRDQKAFPA